MDDFNARISAALVGFMAERGIEKKDVARVLGRSASYVSDRTTGKHDLSVDIVGAVADLARLSTHAVMVELMSRISMGHAG